MYFTSEIRKKGFLVPSIAYLLIYLINCIIIIFYYVSVMNMHLECKQ